MTMIGQPINRVDGPLKVSGRATYAYEHWDAGQPLYGFIVGATIGKGRITRIDTARAEQSPGVRLVMTHRNAPAQGTRDVSIFSEYWRAQPELSGPEIHHYGEPVALVVATTFEQARAAANLVDVEYAVEPGNFDFAARQDQAYAPKVVNAGLPTDTAVGDFECRVRHCRGQSRPALHDAVSVLPADGAARLSGGAARRGPDHLRQRADRRFRARTSIASTLMIDRTAGPRRRAVYRRRVRLQAGHPFRDDPGGARRPPFEPAGQGRDDPAADLSPRRRATHVEPARSSGRGAGRPIGRDRPRGQHVYKPPRGVRRADRRHLSRPLRRARTG